VQHTACCAHAPHAIPTQQTANRRARPRGVARLRARSTTAWPLLLRRAWRETRCSRAPRRFLRDSLAREAEIDGARERNRVEAVTCDWRDGMQVACDRCRTSYNTGRRSLTDAVRVVAHAGGRGRAAPSRGEHEPLCVDDIVVAARAATAPPKLAIFSRPGRGAQAAYRASGAIERIDVRRPDEFARARERLLHQPSQKPRGAGPLSPRLLNAPGMWMETSPSEEVLMNRTSGMSKAPNRAHAAPAGWSAVAAQPGFRLEKAPAGQERLAARSGSCMLKSYFQRLFEDPKGTAALFRRRLLSKADGINGGRYEDRIRPDGDCRGEAPRRRLLVGDRDQIRPTSTRKPSGIIMLPS